jgi:hypothetical protein
MAACGALKEGGRRGGERKPQPGLTAFQQDGLAARPWWSAEPVDEAKAFSPFGTLPAAIFDIRLREAFPPRGRDGRCGGHPEVRILPNRFLRRVFI